MTWRSTAGSSDQVVFAIERGLIPLAMRAPLVAFVAATFEARAGRAECARERTRERSGPIEAAVRAELGALPASHGLTHCAIVTRKRISARREAHKLKRVPSVRTIVKWIQVIEKERGFETETAPARAETADSNTSKGGAS